MRNYGVELYRYGAHFHGDGRHRWRGLPPWLAIKSMRGERGPRGAIRSFTDASRRRLDFIAANGAAVFRSLLTLTYHAEAESWEGDEARNRRVVERSKADLNRFLQRMRGELGPYLWVQEFQSRGVVHYHLLSEGEPDPDKVGLAWCRATGELDDVAAMRHAVKVDRLRSERGARDYLGRYLGKGRQKSLPPGVEAAGRWWGRSRSLELAKLDEIVTGGAKDWRSDRASQQVVRCLRRYVGKVFGGKFRGGMFVDRGGALSARLVELAARLRSYFGTPGQFVELLVARGGEAVGTGEQGCSEATV